MLRLQKMFKNQTKKNIIKAFQNIDHLKRESKIKIDLLYLFLLIPILLTLLNILFLRLFNNAIPDQLIGFIFFISAFINLYRISWTYQNSFRCFFTFMFLLLLFFILFECFFRSPLSIVPANAWLNFVISAYEEGFRTGSFADQIAKLITNNYAFQQLVLDRIIGLFSVFYTHLIYVFIIHFQIRRTQTMLYLYECKLEPKLIAEYIVDPEKNSKLLEETFYRSQESNKSSITFSKSDQELRIFQNGNDQKDQESITNNNLDNQKKNFFNSTSNYFNSLRQGYDLDRNFDEDDSDDQKNN